MATLKQLKKLLKKAGLKASGSKRALTRRAKKAHLLRGGQEPTAVKADDKTPEGRLAEREEAEAMKEDETRGVVTTPSPSAPKPGGFWRRRATRRLSKRAYRW